VVYCIDHPLNSELIIRNKEVIFNIFKCQKSTFTLFVCVWNLVSHIKEERGLKVFEKSLPRRKFEPKMEDATLTLDQTAAHRVGRHTFCSRPTQTPTLCMHGRFFVGQQMVSVEQGFVSGIIACIILVDAA
jgi:hypothetical protein